MLIDVCDHHIVAVYLVCAQHCASIDREKELNEIEIHICVLLYSTLTLETGSNILDSSNEIHTHTQLLRKVLGASSINTFQGIVFFFSQSDRVLRVFSLFFLDFILKINSILVSSHPAFVHRFIDSCNL